MLRGGAFLPMRRLHPRSAGPGLDLADSIPRMKPLRRPAHQPGLIPPRNRHLQRPGPAAPAAPPSTTPPRWDSWLSRGASVAQIVGVALALAGLFYTVIPLYQKAAVDEQLARREMELKAVEASLTEGKAEVYRLRRDDLVRVTVRGAAEECSDSFRGFMDLPAGEREPEEAYRLRLDVNVKDCVDRHLARAETSKQLGAADLEAWRAWAKPIVAELEAERLRTRQTVQELPRRAAADPSLLDDDGEFSQITEELFKHYEAYLFPTPQLRQERDKHQFARRLQFTRERVAMAYRLSVSTRLTQTLEPKMWKVERAKKEAAARVSVGASRAGP